MPTTADFIEIRKEFPITENSFEVLGSRRPLIYFDHAASTHPPRRILKTYTEFLERYYANIHRGNHNLSLIASEMYEKAIETLAKLIGGNLNTHAMVMVSNTTEALNLAAHVMSSHDGITLCTGMEHHSNDLPHRRYGKVKYVNLTPEGALDLDDFENKLKTHPVKLVAITAASNVTGYMPDIDKIAELAHRHGARILVDGAQILAHHPFTVAGRDGGGDLIDFFAAAGHKAYAPFGSAFLYGPRELLDKAEPYYPGGGTVVYVTHDEVLYAFSPERHEGGTPNIAGTVAFSEGAKFLQEVGLDNIRKHELILLKRALDGLIAIGGIEIYGPKDPDQRLGVISFNIPDVPHEMVSAILNYEGCIATRNGCFCAHPYVLKLLRYSSLEKYKELATQCPKQPLPGAVRASFGIYNTEEEVDEFLRMVRLIRDKKWKGEYKFSQPDLCRPTFFEAS